jgi:hypothetical protein
MVIFCRKSSTPFAFRKPSEPDLLGSNSRRYVLVPQHEVNATQAYMSEEGWKDRVIKRGGQGVKVLERYHARGAVGHWDVMRTVIPARVWENW